MQDPRQSRRREDKSGKSVLREKEAGRQEHRDDYQGEKPENEAGKKETQIGRDLLNCSREKIRMSLRNARGKPA